MVSRSYTSLSALLLWIAVVCLAAAPLALAQQNPFEEVPDADEQSPFETVQPPDQPQTPQSGDMIEAIEFRGGRLITQAALRSAIFTQVGDIYNEEALHRDLITLWNQGRFDDVRLERERGENGWIVRFILVERPVVRSLQFEGNKSVTTSDILERFRERNVGLSVESQFDASKLQRAQIVLRDYLAEQGRQFAEVEAEIEQLPPSSLAITLRVDEGPKVKVGDVNFMGNDAFSDRELRRSMIATKGLGIPKSIFFEEIFPKSYDPNALDYDVAISIGNFYRNRGYFQGAVSDVQVEIVDVGNGKFRLPLIWPSRPGKRANIDLTIDEGKIHRLNNINFTGVEFFNAPEALMQPFFQMQQGDVFSTEKLETGIEQMEQFYGEFGYINFFATPNFDIVGDEDLINLTIDVDEGEQFFIRRIDFAGNTTTRDKVIRREILLDEGDIYSKRLWQLSVLRLNQLGYFEVLDEEEAVDIRTDTRTNTVDLTLNVQERGKNTVQLNGGVSGIQGSFLGFSYSTNNFVGLGETLSFSSSLGTRFKNVTFGFTEPYFLDRPITLGFSVNFSRFDFDQAREASVLAGANLIPLFNQVGTNNLLNYNTNSKGFSVFSSYPLRNFTRIGVSYSYAVQSVVTNSPAAEAYFTNINFLNISGPNQLDGIRTSSITPSYIYNTVNNPITPTGGTRFQMSAQLSGGFLGGGVNQILPVLDIAHYRPGFRNHTIGLHLYASYLTGFGGRVAAPFNRFFMGGENDVRGFNLFNVSPIAFVPNAAAVRLFNNDGTPRKQLVPDPNTGALISQDAQQIIPTYQLVFPGGDTKIVANFEYRIPLFGPVTLAAFFDAGVNRLSNTSQLEINPSRINQLNQQFPEAAFADRAVISRGTQKIRTSTGLELQVLMPVFNQPFRIYWAYNPTRVEQFIQPPIVADRSNFPNSVSFLEGINTFGRPVPFVERKSVFRFTIGRTF